MAHDLAHPEAQPLTPAPPRWVEELLVQPDGPFSYATASIPDAIHLEARALRDRVASAYLEVIRDLEALDRYPVRFWNFVPGIGEAMPGDLDRYMVFNAGRYDAYVERYGPRTIAAGHCHSIGTASAVGVAGPDLSVHCLAMDRPGTPVENPRQTSAWQYSARYGPLPPCFSRATIVTLRGRRLLLIGGTASVVGEESRHAGNPEAQLDETLRNMEALLKAASGGDDRAPLERLRDVRAYITAPRDGELVKRVLSARCPHLRTLTVVVAQVCRRELLLEIEGVADL